MSKMNDDWEFKASKNKAVFRDKKNPKHKLEFEGTEAIIIISLWNNLNKTIPEYMIVDALNVGIPVPKLDDATLAWCFEVQKTHEE